MSDRREAAGKLTQLVSTVEEYDALMTAVLPHLLDHAAGQMRRFLRETGQWADDVSHEKLALRWGYELVERFLVHGRTEVPCRPLFLLDSLIARYFSRPEAFCYGKDLLSPLGRFIEGLTARAVISRDALMALFYHLYGFGQSQVARVLGLGAAESQRVYKNFDRWRRGGWQRAVDELGLTEHDLQAIEWQQRREPEQFNADADRLCRLVQAHYRKSEPEHFPCLSRQQWAHLFDEGYGYDYRVWHLALCLDCLVTVCQARRETIHDARPRLDVRIRPLLSGRLVESCQTG
ncbi:hypothetical protein [Candidatus Nitrospira bockiana]